MKKIFLLGVPNHGNLGDNAIALAEENLLKKYFSEFELVQLPEKGLIEAIEKIQIEGDDIILFHGGGNLGDLYDLPEAGRRYVVEHYPKNKIIFLPQTMCFIKSEELKISSNIYNNHQNLTMLAREKRSFEQMKENFKKCKIYLTPDMVMTMNKYSSQPRSGALLLFRNDREKVVNDSTREKIIESVKTKFSHYTLSDMYVNEISGKMEGEYREKELNKIFEKFNEAEIVITDRLHAMIFAAITQTPCVALNSQTRKIEECYYWFRDLKHIKLCENIEELQTKIDEVMSVNVEPYDNEKAEKQIVEILKNEINC